MSISVDPESPETTSAATGVLQICPGLGETGESSNPETVGRVPDFTSVSAAPRSGHAPLCAAHDRFWAGTGAIVDPVAKFGVVVTVTRLADLKLCRYWI